MFAETRSIHTHTHIVIIIPSRIATVIFIYVYIGMYMHVCMNVCECVPAVATVYSSSSSRYMETMTERIYTLILYIIVSSCNRPVVGVFVIYYIVFS